MAQLIVRNLKATNGIWSVKVTIHREDVKNCRRVGSVDPRGRTPGDFAEALTGRPAGKTLKQRLLEGMPPVGQDTDFTRSRNPRQALGELPRAT